MNRCRFRHSAGQSPSRFRPCRIKAFKESVSPGTIERISAFVQETGRKSLAFDGVRYDAVGTGSDGRHSGVVAASP